MRILYYNLSLGAFDGSNMHARGLLDAFKRICGSKNVYIAVERSKNDSYRPAIGKLRNVMQKIAYPIVVLRRRFVSKWSTAKIVDKVIKDGFKPEYVFARFTTYDSTPLRLATKFKCKLILEVNAPMGYEEMLRGTSNQIRHSIAKYEQQIFEKATGLYFVSETLAKMTQKNYSNLDPKKMIGVCNGYISELYDISETNKLKIRNRIREEQKASDKFVVVFLGSMITWHGIDRLIEIATIMEKNTDVEFWVLGDGEKRDIIQYYIQKHKNMKWFGNVPFEEMRDKLWGSDLGIMPYERVEHFYFSPLKMFDMIGAELPFIGLGIGQIKEICFECLNNDFTLSTVDAKSWVERIEEICDDETRYTTMKGLLRQVRSRYTWDVCAQKLISWMESL